METGTAVSILSQVSVAVSVSRTTPSTVLRFDLKVPAARTPSPICSQTQRLTGTLRDCSAHADLIRIELHRLRGSLAQMCCSNVFVTTHLIEAAHCLDLATRKSACVTESGNMNSVQRTGGPRSPTNMSAVTLAHHWLVTYRGGEKVLAEFRHLTASCLSVFKRVMFQRLSGPANPSPLQFIPE
jgi:hypothetical protein